jgi:tRNA-specific 2-thiouridylase
MARIFVAMSGGVDSSVAAALLVRQGHDVTGVTMQLLPEGDFPGGCCSFEGVRDARRVCDVLGIPHYTLNMRDAFARGVVEPFCDEYASGRTPNPCIACNDVVKFDELWRRVRLQGADFLATGHYARVLRDARGERWLARGADAAKDQSYFLYRMTREQLDRTLFPLGELAKVEVRRTAEKLGLPTADRPESQDVCFLADGGSAAFVAARRPEAGEPGDIVDQSGQVLGRHGGIGRYTVGQRKGLRLSAPQPLYVVRLDAADRKVTVGSRADLYSRTATCTGVVWRGPDLDVAVAVQVRYRQAPVGGAATVDDDGLRITFDEKVAGVAPGQAAVCYNGDVVLGGGVVKEAE